MIFRELQTGNKIYGYSDGKLVKTFEFISFLAIESCKARINVKDIEKGNNLILTIGNVNQSICSIGNKKISTRELKC